MPEIFYDSTITKLKGVELPKDLDNVLALIAERKKLGRAMIVKVKDMKAGETADLTDFEDFHQQLKNRGIGNSGLVVEIIIRDPTTFGIKPHLMPKELDRGDDNALNWGGERGDGNLPNHVMQSAPMFFRANGAGVDLVDLHRGRAIFLICNGPSFLEVDHQALRQPGIVTFGINNGGQMFRPDYWTCVDTPYRFCESIWADNRITKFVPMAHFWKQVWKVEEKRYGDAVHTFPRVFGYRRNEWFRARQFLTEDTINWGCHKDRGGGRSVMLAALRMCHLLGFKRVYLLGCDFKMSDEDRYFFDEQRTLAAVNNNNNTYRLLMDRFKDLQPILLEDGFEVFNCNPDSALEAFPKMSWEDAVKKETIDVSASTHGMYCKEGDRQAESAAAGAGPPVEVREEAIAVEEEDVPAAVEEGG
jgi:hypothetical protein